MRTVEAEIRNHAGLHARPSALFVQTAIKFSSEVKVVSDGEEVNGKSIMGLMLLAAEKGRILEIVTEGEDEDVAAETLRKLVQEDKFGEE